MLHQLIVTIHNQLCFLAPFSVSGHQLIDCWSGRSCRQAVRQKNRAMLCRQIAEPHKAVPRAPSRCQVPSYRQQIARQRQSSRIGAVTSQQLQYWDLVEYYEQGQPPRLRLGLVTQVDGSSVTLEPLVEEEEDVWVPEGGELELAPVTLQLGAVVRTIEGAFGQRQDKEGNPHGEHAHDAWQVLQPLAIDIYRGT